MGWSRAELESFAGRTIPDLIPDDLRLLFVGINPGLISAATGLHFARRGNRFFPALMKAGLVDTIDPAEAAQQLRERGVGITNIVARASARADELSRDELLAGRIRLEELALEHRPRVVAIAGITSYRTAFARRNAVPGPQPDSIGESRLWVVPNPSGLNAHATVESLASAYAEAARAAGVL